ncbi:hypothetical protein M413DRAFT_28524 [Hebeloma cylindrosporum]|uniref:Fungal-type protein kinase domain-containing protein n=1 Tax=Hebeloma cylindrosporum TaxID=76867 RepID=A0A0C3CAY8_HEBCY|nr:hypothetical protein M413DRAFT_28524 [Hebeloma cylindrosporum h7]
MVKGLRKLRTRHRKPVRNPSPQPSDSSHSDSETEEIPTAAEVERNRRNKTLGWEAQGHFVGPVDPAWFIDYYFNIQEIDKPSFPVGSSPTWTGLRENISKVDMRQYIIDGARRFLKDHVKESSGFVQGHSAEDSAPDDGSPSIIYYRDLLTPPRSKLDFSNVEYFVEAQTSQAFDPFVDNDDNDSDRYEYYPFEATADLRMTTRGQILAYCTTIARSQFRTHVFGVIILGNCARLFRWDPSSMVVTSLFDYTNQTDNYLAQFIWYYDNASPLTRGHDTSIEHISETQAYDFVGQEIAERVKAINPYHSHFCTMNIPDRENGEIQHSHLISYPPPCQPSSSFERMTRTVQAFDLETKEFVFVKDYWRDVAAEAEKEGDIYTLLEKHNIPNIAPFGNGNDIQCKVCSKDSEDSVLRPV